jgi:hypothetical protein
MKTNDYRVSIARFLTVLSLREDVAREIAIRKLIEEMLGFVADCGGAWQFIEWVEQPQPIKVSDLSSREEKFREISPIRYIRQMPGFWEKFTLAISSPEPSFADIKMLLTKYSAPPIIVDILPQEEFKQRLPKRPAPTTNRKRKEPPQHLTPTNYRTHPSHDFKHTANLLPSEIPTTNLTFKLNHYIQALVALISTATQISQYLQDQIMSLEDYEHELKRIADRLDRHRILSLQQSLASTPPPSTSRSSIINPHTTFSPPPPSPQPTPSPSDPVYFYPTNSS